MTSPTTRSQLAASHRLVIKIGSTCLTNDAGHLDPQRLTTLVNALATRLAAGREVVVVSSGAQAAGMRPLGLTARPRSLAEAQAAASVGQGLLMAEYTRAFADHGRTVGQVLLTSRDIVRRSTYGNADRALTTLLERGVVPIVNENDAVATDEIRFGDNDRLAAFVAHLVRADALVLLTDVDGLRTAPPSRPGSRRIAEVFTAADLEGIEVSGRGSEVGTGGMITKVHAATLATSSGIPVLLTSADTLDQALDPDLGAEEAAEFGTFFHVTGKRLAAKRLWLGYAAAARGKLHVDQGAATAVTSGKKSLLPVGVTRVEGEFNPGDVVEILDPAGVILARGVVGYSWRDLEEIKGLSLAEITRRLGPGRGVEAVHRDELTPHARSRRPTQA